MRTRFNQPSLKGGPARREPWYAANRWIRTQAAASHAAAVAEWAAARRMLDVEFDEHALFMALHTCAYRAAQDAGNRITPTAERTHWIRNWRMIRDHIVHRNLGLAYLMIGRLKARDLDQDDRLSEALYGLSRAVERFDPWRGYRFSTYACNVIARALIRHAEREAQHRERFPQQYSSAIERPAEEPDAARALYVERLAAVMAGNHSRLSPLEARVIAERFPNCPGRRLTFQEIGNGVSLSKERIRQIEKTALAKLREALEMDSVLRPRH